MNLAFLMNIPSFIFSFYMIGSLESSQNNNFLLEKRQKVENLQFLSVSFPFNFESFSLSTNFTKMATKWAKINLQTSFRPIWNPENQGYKIGYEKSYQEQQLRPKNSSEKSVRLLSADTVDNNLEWHLHDFASN